LGDQEGAFGLLFLCLSDLGLWVLYAFLAGEAVEFKSVGLTASAAALFADVEEPTARSA
jgi:hypothetical protein